MKLFKTAFLYLAVSWFFLSARPTFAQSSPWSVVSPDGSISISIDLNTNGAVYFSVTDNSTTILENSLTGFSGTSAADTFTNNLVFVSQATNAISETYSLPTGKSSNYANNANELTLSFQNQSGNQVDYIFRAYNDGVAYRYRANSLNSNAINLEQSEFTLPSQSNAWLQNYANNYEAMYGKYTTPITPNIRVGMPVLANITPGEWALITEVHTTGGHPTSNLISSSDGNSLRYSLPSGEALPVETQSPFISPWRVAIVGSLNEVVESTLVENLSTPTTIADTTWISPGISAWSWWSDNLSPSNLQTQKDYVDFAAQMNWDYILVDEGWQSSWIPELVSYASQKNVKVILWYFFGGNFSGWTPQGWTPSYQAADTTFKQLKNWGVVGAKIDFFDSDDQNTNTIREEILRAAADNQMILNFHGDSIPVGERRRWPQLLTREAVYGAEHKNNAMTHITTLPFTRNVIGPMDYTPVTFSISGNTTYSSQLAQAVVFESGLQHFADSATSYQSIPEAMEVLNNIPTTWDETKLIEGYPGEYVAIARRKGNDWFVGALSTTQRTIITPMSIFGNNSYNATFYVDGATTTDIIKYTEQLSSADVLGFDINANGGVVIKLTNAGTQTPTCPTDLNGDNLTDLSDYSILAANFFSTNPSNIKADINSDGLVDLTDYSALAAQFLKVCQ